MSPRRSSRARTSQPQQITPQQQTNSSSSSISSGRADRTARSHHKTLSPQSSAAPQSRSSEEVEDPAKPPIRRTRSSQEDIKDNVRAAPEDEDEENEEDVTRCICGQQEYPGIPVPVEDTLKAISKGISASDPIAAPASVPEDTGGLFIQCDVCKVWQHGGCVGIINQAMIPNDEYFCEECRKDLHKITSTANGQKFSRYIPVQELVSLPSSPSPAPQDTLSTKPKSSRSSRTNAESLSGKRRSTMNSRDAAYDEAEQIRRAIEESRKDGDAPGTSVSTRRGKRSRSESEHGHEDAKRQRISSDSSSSHSDSKTLHPNADSDEEADQSSKIAGGNHKPIRGATTRNNRDKEIRDREEKRERERADAAGRRKGRAERRRVDESEPSEEPLSRTTSTKGAENPVPRLIPTPPTTEIPLPKSSHHKKTGRPPARRGRVGRNQYTKDRDPRPSDPALPDSKSSPLRSQSHSRNADDRPNHPNYNSNCATNGTPVGGAAGHSWASNINPNSEGSRPNFKTRRLSPKCNTMNEMKRRVSNILEFISRTQIEMAGSSLPVGEESAPVSRTRTRTHSSTTIVAATISAQDSDRHAPAPVGSTATAERFNEASNLSASTNLGGGRLELAAGLTEEVFKNLSSMEMMDVLTRGLMKWQGEYGNVDGK